MGEIACARTVIPRITPIAIAVFTAHFSIAGEIDDGRRGSVNHEAEGQCHCAIKQIGKGIRNYQGHIVFVHVDDVSGTGRNDGNAEDTRGVRVGK